jgi:predicted PurR-regulated permease PerM
LISWIDKTFRVAIPTDADHILTSAKEFLSDLAPGSLSRAGGWVATFLAGSAGAISGLISIVLVPLFLFFFLKDWKTVTGSIMSLIPTPMQPPINAKLAQIDRSLSAYVRGVLTVATILAVIYSIALSALGVPLGLLIGVLAGYAYVVPFMSSVVGISLGVLFSLLEFHGWGQVAGVVIIFVVGNAIESFVLTPRIVGDSLGLSPLTVILAVMIGANLFGFLGVMLALPTAAVLHVIGGDLIAAWRSSNYYRSGPEAT